MELLRILTIGYAAVLVLALAASLIAILYFLWRIGTVLGKVSSVLTEARDRTNPLPELLAPLASLPNEEGTEFVETVQRFSEAVEQVEERIRQPARAGAA